MKKVLSVVIFVTCLSAAFLQCTIEEGAFLFDEFPAADGTLTYDNLGPVFPGWNNSGPDLVITMNGQTITFSGGSNCKITNTLNQAAGIHWDGSSYWPGSDTETPGFYIISTNGAICTMEFSPSIVGVVLRSNTGETTGSTAYITDQAINLVACNALINSAPTSGVNSYSVFGFGSKTRIRQLRITSVAGAIAVADNIQYTMNCPTGYEITSLGCQNIDECTVAPPCDPNASCEDTDGSFTCTCDAEYAGNGIVCKAIDQCATTPCNDLASCMNDGLGSFNCTCPDGYVGDGIGAEGCQLPPPVAAPVTAPVSNSPVSAGPVASTPKSTPQYKVSIGACLCGVPAALLTSAALLLSV